MPRPDPAKRTPLWLQRLRAKDLLQVARQFPDFPIVIETFRECLDDDLDLPRLRGFLDAIQAGSIRVVRRQGEVPSPMTSELIFAFTAAYLYEWDEPKRQRPQPARRRWSTRTCSAPCSATGSLGSRLAGSPGDRPRRHPARRLGASAAHRRGDGRTPPPARRPDRRRARRADGRVPAELQAGRPCRHDRAPRDDRSPGWIVAEERAALSRGLSRQRVPSAASTSPPSAGRGRRSSSGSCGRTR